MWLLRSLWTLKAVPIQLLEHPSTILKVDSTSPRPPHNHFDSHDFPGNVVFPGGLPFLVFHESANNPVNNLVRLDFGCAFFDFLSFELVVDSRVQARNPVINPAITLIASDGRSLVAPQGSNPGFVGTVSPNWLGIQSVTFDINFNSIAAGNVLLDDVEVEPSAAAIPLPVPAVLYLSALVTVGFFWRRRVTRS
jgi:hypothetical protein